MARFSCQEPFGRPIRHAMNRLRSRISNQSGPIHLVRPRQSDEHTATGAPQSNYRREDDLEGGSDTYLAVKAYHSAVKLHGAECLG